MSRSSGKRRKRLTKGPPSLKGLSRAQKQRLGRVAFYLLLPNQRSGKELVYSTEVVRVQLELTGIETDIAQRDLKTFIVQRLLRYHPEPMSLAFYSAGLQHRLAGEYLFGHAGEEEAPAQSIAEYIISEGYDSKRGYDPELLCVLNHILSLTDEQEQILVDVFEARKEFMRGTDFLRQCHEVETVLRLRLLARWDAELQIDRKLGITVDDRAVMRLTLAALDIASLTSLWERCLGSTTSLTPASITDKTEVIEHLVSESKTRRQFYNLYRALHDMDHSLKWRPRFNSLPILLTYLDIQNLLECLRRNALFSTSTARESTLEVAGVAEFWEGSTEGGRREFLQSCLPKLNDYGMIYHDDDAICETLIGRLLHYVANQEDTPPDVQSTLQRYIDYNNLMLNPPN